MIYTILAILYIVTCVGYYKLLSKEAVVNEAFGKNPKLATICLVICSVAWPVVSVVNYLVAAFQK